MDIKDYHLQSPIRGDERKLFTNPSPEFNNSDIDIQRMNTPNGYHGADIQSEKLYGKILAGVYDTQLQNLEWVNQHIPIAYEAVKIVTEAAMKGLGFNDFQVRDLPKNAKSLLSYVSFWEDVRNSMQYLQFKRSRSFKKLRKTITIFKEMYYSSGFLLVLYSSKPYVFDYSQVTMIVDTLWARVNVILYNALLPDVPGRLPYHILEKCYKTIDEQFLTHGNQIYNGIKCWEPLLNGVAIDQYDILRPTKNYFNEMRIDAITNGHAYMTGLADWIRSQELEPDQLSELLCCFRHFGHPTVNEEAGCKKIYDIMRNRPTVDPQILSEVCGSLKQQFVASFISMKDRWPLVINADEITNENLKKLVKGHIRHANLYGGDIPAGDWNQLRFGHELEFDYFDDFTELIDDKSIAPNLSEVRGIFSRDILGYTPPRLTRDRRLLKALLEMEHLSIREIINKVERKDIPLEWRLILLHAKERELKIEPRMFCLLALEMRMFFSATEKNLKERVFPFYPQQTMTLNEIGLNKKLLRFSKNESISDFVKVKVQIDFKSWNIHWTHLSTADVFMFLDSLFNLNGVYSFSHEFFEMALVVLNSFYNPPKSFRGRENSHGMPEECDTCWYNHTAGFEGIRQKGWTLITIGILLCVERRTGIKSMKIGQGDNQVCKLFIPKTDTSMSDDDFVATHQDYINEQVDAFMQALDEVTRGMGLVIKESESPVTTNIMSYSKQLILNGAYLSNHTKSISRLIPDVNEIYPSIFSKTVAIQTPGLSAAAHSFHMVYPYIYSSILTLFHLFQSVSFSSITQKPIDKRKTEWMTSLDALIFLLCTSGDIGGLPVLNLYSYLYRGHPDQLTAYTSFIREVATRVPIIQKLYLYLQDRDYDIGQADPELLVSNPCSTNIKTYPLLSSQFKRVLEGVVKRGTKNRMLKQLFPDSMVSKDKQLFQFLVDHTPLHPRLLHEIFRLTPTATRFAFLARFSNTKTTRKMLHKKDPEIELDILDDFGEDTPRLDKLDLEGVDQSFIDHLHKLYNEVRRKQPLPSQDLICPTLLAQDMRDTSWKPLIQERSIEGVTVPFPAHQFSLSRSVDSEHTDCISEKEYCVFIPDTKDAKTLLTTVGDYSAFLGSLTRERIIGRIFSICSNARPYKAAERAMVLGSWCIDPQSSLMKYLQGIAEARTDVPLHILEQSAGYVSGGSMPHRLDDHITKNHTANNTLPNLTTHVMISTDEMGRFSRGFENYVMHFQGMLHFGLAMVSISCCEGVPIENSYHLHYRGVCCEESIPDVVVGGMLPVPSVKSYPDNPLLFASVSYEIQKGISSIREFKISESNDPGWAAASILLGKAHHQLSSKITGYSEQIDHQAGPIGVQEVLRIGIGPILESFSKLICLYTPPSLDDTYLVLSALSNDIWADISSVCLLPEVLPSVIKYLNMDGIPDLYSHPGVLGSCFTEKVKKRVIELSDETKADVWEKLPPFHVTQSLNIEKILHLWCSSIQRSTDVGKRLRTAVIKAISNYHLKYNLNPGMYNGSLASELHLSCIKELGIGVFSDRILPRLPVLALNPPESILRSGPPRVFAAGLQQHDLEEIDPRSSTKGTYAMSLELPERSDIYSIQTIHATDFEPREQAHVRNDHMYKYLSNVSGGWPKLLEILFGEKVIMDSYGVCLADGEGSMSKLVSHLTRQVVLYNSLVNKCKLESHRGHTYIPGAFAGHPNLIIGGKQSTVTGGDITCKDTRLAICNAAYKSFGNIPPCLVTCDAETVSTITPSLLVSLVRATVDVASTLCAKTVVMKLFITDGRTTAIILGHFNLYWRKVKLIVPTFSSHETTEAYIFATDFSPLPGAMTRKDDPIDSINIASANSVMSAVDQIKEFCGKRRDWSRPLQELDPDNTEMILSIGRMIGLKSNVPSAFYKLTNAYITYDRRLTCARNVILAEDLLIKMCRKMSHGIRSWHTHDKTIHVVQVASAKRGPVHMHMDTIMEAIINMNVIHALGRHWRCRTDILRRKLFGALEYQVELADPDGKVIYTYRITDMVSWQKKHCKHLWKVIGTLVRETKTGVLDPTIQEDN